MPRFTPIVCAVLCALQLSVTSNGQEGAADVRETEARRLGYYAEPGKLYLHLVIPGPISKVDYAALADIFDLSDAQRVKFRELYESYLQEDWEYRKQHLQPLWDRSAEVAVMSVQPSLEKSEAYAALFADRRSALRPLFEREDRLLMELVPFLAEEQVMKLKRAKNYRLRQRCQAVKGKYPGCNTDLLQYLREIQRSDEDFFVTNSEEFQSRIEEYDAAATHLFETAAERRVDAMVENNRCMSQSRYIYDNEQDEKLSFLKRRAIDLEKIAMNEKVLFANRAIHDINRKYLDIFAALLSPKHGEELTRWFLESTYRGVYPDPYDLTDMFAQLLNGESLTAEQKTIVGAIQEDFDRRRNELSERMIKEYLDWNAHMEIRSGYEIAKYEEYQKTMEKLQNQRADNAFKAVESVIGMLEENQRTEVEAAATEFRDRIKEFENYRAELARQGRDWPRHDE